LYYHRQSIQSNSRAWQIETLGGQARRVRLCTKGHGRITTIVVTERGSARQNRPDNCLGLSDDQHQRHGDSTSSMLLTYSTLQDVVVVHRASLCYSTADLLFQLHFPFRHSKSYGTTQDGSWKMFLTVHQSSDPRQPFRGPIRHVVANSDYSTL